MNVTNTVLAAALAAISVTAGARDLRIKLDASVPATQATLLKQDFDRLKDYRGFKADDAALKQLLSLNTINAASMQKWLEERVQVVVGEDFDRAEHLQIVSTSYAYPNANLYPIIDDTTPPAEGLFGEEGTTTEVSSGPRTVMSNMGAGLYMTGKFRNVLIGLNLEGFGLLTFKSPRAGLIQIGEGLFRTYGENGPALNSVALTRDRMLTFFHEGRHSDGNGESLTFAHAICPVGHDYEGYYACDRNLNGPYTVGSKIAANMLAGCTNCSDVEKNLLRLESLDSAARVLRKDPLREEERASTAIEMVSLQQEKGELGSSRADVARAREIDAELAKLSSLLENGRPIVAWDATPEGRR